MGMYGLGTETYLYVNGLIVNEEIRISEDKILVPVHCKLPINIVFQLLKNDVDFAIAILCAQSITSQLKINAVSSQKLASFAWNAQWDLVLLSAIFNCNSICNLQCTEPVEMISNGSILQVTNYHLQGILEEPYTVTKEDSEWLEKYFTHAQNLLNTDAFMTAVHSMATYRWHSIPRVQLAILWAGIESLFGISSELSFRISLYVSKFLAGDNKDKVKDIFDETKKLYKAQTSAVHGDNIKGDLGSLVNKSATLLNRLIVKCIMKNELPDADNLTF